MLLAGALGFGFAPHAAGAMTPGPAVLPFGDAQAPGNPSGLSLNRPIVGMASTPNGGGYWLVARDGGIFTFGNATFSGSTGGQHLNQPIVGMASTPDGRGYWMVARDGGIFTFGNATFNGSGAGSLGEGRVAAGMVHSPSGRGYNLLAVAASTRVGFAGDVHGLGRVASFQSRGGDPLAGMRSLLDANDANIVNLETTVGSSGSPQGKQYTFQSPPELLSRLHSAGVTVVNLANNHSLDFGAGALMETITNAHNAGLLVVGAGGDKTQAYAPAVVNTPSGTVAFLAFSQVLPRGWAATDNRAGVASAYDLNAATAAVRSARAQVDHVVVMVHAGVERTDCPTDIQRSLSAALVDARADVVASSHPHVLQGLEMRGRSLIDYSLGNFVWYSGNAATGLLTAEIGTDGFADYEFAPATIDDSGSPQPLSGPPANDALANLASLAPGAGRC